MAFEVPETCTLPTAAQPLRQAEFAAMCSTALRRPERLSRLHLRLTLAGGDGRADAVRDLAARETECCSFFDFTITPAADCVVLDIEVPESYVEVLDGLSALATDAAPSGSR
ncbi:MAG: hypothetical protein ACR2JG_03295 [Geodermatophilaceae bacterium]